MFNNRPEKLGGDTLLGLFLNVLPFRLQLKEGAKLKEELIETFNTKIKLYEHKHIPYAHLKSAFNRDLYKFGFNFIHLHVLKQSEKFITKRGGFDRTSIPFLLEVTQWDSFKLELKAHDDYVSQEYLNYFGHYLKTALLNVLKNKNEIALDANDYQKIVIDWNATHQPFPQEKTLHQLFEEQVQRTPNEIALVYEDTRITYQELNQQANQVAHYLIEQYRINPDELIALYLNRNALMVIAILAVLKSGAAYVPIDPDYTKERVSYILQDTNARVILSNMMQQQKVHALAFSCPIVVIEDLLDRIPFRHQQTVNPTTLVTSKHLAYVIYTSGTTGKPNGVMIEHSSVINSLIALYPVYRLSKNKRATAYSSYVFDMSVAEIFTVLTGGGELHLLGKERYDINQLSAYLLTQRINIAFLPPAILSILPRIKYPALEVLIFGGERCPQAVGEFWSLNHEFYNYYGPTEFTIYATGKRVNVKNINNIGTPIPNSQVFILDKRTNLLPIGSIGELYLSGAGIARGYLNNPTLTAEKFISNKWNESHHDKYTKLYKTGDLVRWLPNGNLEYIGRNDSQVKIRGYRVELGAIEAALRKYSGVSQVIVLLKTKSDTENSLIQYLAAYYVSEHELDEVKIKEYLALHLENYMLPTVLIRIANMPLTVNGKLDVAALPAPTLHRSKNYAAPNNLQEQLICNAFSTTLNINPVGVDDDFFELGGNSIQVIKLIAKLQADFAIKVTDVYRMHTPKNMAKNVRLAGNVLRKRLNDVKASYAQQKLLHQTIAAQVLMHEDLYLTKFHNFKIDCTAIKNITGVLLTGATGYLGCNLLNQLLKLTHYAVFVTVRAETKQQAIDRIKQKYEFYFSEDLTDLIAKRVFILNADLEKPMLGLAQTDYKNLATQIDSIVHAAALVKHYGAAEMFYAANVQETINLLELAKLTRLKDFHYISTTSVLNFTSTSEKIVRIGTEDDIPTGLSESNNIYVKTKLQAECQVFQYRTQGINSNIYRVGNLTINSENFHKQENLHENAFFNWLQGLLSMQCIADEISTVEMSQVDFTAKAIVKLFDKTQLINQIYHVFNPNLVDLADAIPKLKTVPIDNFIDYIDQQLHDNPEHYDESLIKFLLHQGWLEERDPRQARTIKLLQTKTAHILNQLKFRWPLITSQQFNAYIER